MHYDERAKRAGVPYKEATGSYDRVFANGVELYSATGQLREAIAEAESCRAAAEAKAKAAKEAKEAELVAASSRIRIRS